jgi:hypothetical protein
MGTGERRERFETPSGIELERLYGPDEAAVDYDADLGDSGSLLSARVWPDGPLGRVRSSHPDGIRFGRPDGGGRGGSRRRCDRHTGRYAASARRHPPGPRVHLDDDQRHGSDPPGALRGLGRRARHAESFAARHRTERHPQRVRGTRNLHLSRGGEPAPRHGPVCVLRRRGTEVESDLDQRLPHARGWSDRDTGDRVHVGERAGVRPLRARRRLVAG